MLPRCSKEVATAGFTRQVRVGTPTKERLYWGLCRAVGTARPGAKQKARGRTQVVRAKSGWNRIHGKQPVRMAASCGGGVQGSRFVPRAVRQG